MKRILLLLSAIVLVVIITNLVSNADMNNTVQSLQVGVSTVAYAGEFTEIKTAVDEFLEIRAMRGTEEAKELALRLDERLNNLQLVKNYCIKNISTLELAYENNPYEKLQQICPELKKVSFSKAIELFSLI